MKYVWSHRFQDHSQQHDEGVEIDVRFTKDHSPVLLHDPLFHKKDITTYHSSQLTNVLFLNDFLKSATAKIIMMEVKACSTIDLDHLYECLLMYPDQSIVIASFDEHCLNYFSRFHYPLMYLTCNRWIDVPSLLVVIDKIRFVGLSIDVITKEYITWLHNAVSVEIFLFTLNDDTMWNWINDSFPHMIDGIITDQPLQCRHFFDSL